MRIEEYALIGDTQTVALVSCDGFAHVALVNTACSLSSRTARPRA